MLTTALALVALPGLAGSRAPSALEPVPAGAIQSISVPAARATSPIVVEGLDRAYRSSGPLTAATTFIRLEEVEDEVPLDRAAIDQPEATSASARKPAKQTLTGVASFYHHGTTAMRLPRGTVVIICGAGGCVERVINDYGPQLPERIVDLYVDDFFAICGCPSWTGLTDVTVYVY